MCTEGKGLGRCDQMYCKFKSRGFMGLWLSHTTSPCFLSCQNLSRKISSHLKSKAFSKFFRGAVIQKGQSERFIKNRKKSNLKESLFSLSPLNPRHRISQQLPRMEREGEPLKLPHPDCVAWRGVSPDAALDMLTLVSKEQLGKFTKTLFHVKIQIATLECWIMS